MTQALVFSLHPQWSDLVFSGAKTIEVRRRFAPRITYPAVGLIYTSSPVRALRGVVTLTAAQTLSTPDIAVLADKTCIPDAVLAAYLEGKPGVCVFLSNPVAFPTPIPLATLRTLGFTPPQAFCYAQPLLLAYLQDIADDASRLFLPHASG